MGLPFLFHSWENYLQRSFDLGRVFLLKWSVNYAFLPESTLQSRYLAVALLSFHLLILVMFTQKIWTARYGGILGLLGLRGRENTKYLRAGFAQPSPAAALTAILTSNLIGITFARTLHYQFYAWYFHSLPYLLWKTELPVIIRYVPKKTFPNLSKITSQILRFNLPPNISFS